MSLQDKTNFRLLWGILMVVIYLGMFFLLVFTNMFMNLSLTLRIICGSAFLIYGVFRGFRIWKYGR